MGVKKEEIKAIVFDIGGVICPDENIGQYIKLSKEFNFDLGYFRKLRKRFIKKALKKNTPYFWYETQIANELRIPKDKFISSWQKLRKKDMIKSTESNILLKKLSNNYLLGTVTNVTPANQMIREKNKIYTYFKINVCSYKCGYSKPSKSIFQILMRGLKKEGIEPSETVFIDNEDKNLIPAKRLGINTILFKNNRELIKDLKKLGVKI